MIEPKNEGPWWVKSITIFGVPAAIAMYLVWALVSGQTSALSEISATLQAQKGAIAEIAVITRDTANDAKAAAYRSENYLRLLCVNTASGTAERNACLSVR